MYYSLYTLNQDDCSNFWRQNPVKLPGQTSKSETPCSTNGAILSSDFLMFSFFFCIEQFRNIVKFPVLIF